MNYDEYKTYYDLEDAVILTDQETNEQYIINPAGDRIYLSELKDY